MAVNKNFVVKNGIEVATDVIVVSKDDKTVGIGTSIGEVLLDVRGAIGATHINVSGFATIFHLDATNFNIDNLTGTAATVTSITVTNANIINGIVTSITGTSGTFTNGTITNLTGTAATITNLDTTDFTTTNGITTNGTITNLTGTAATITTLDTTNFTATNGTITNLTGTAATITNGNITNLTGTAGTITTLDVTDANITNVIATNINASGVITATSFSGDGSGLVDVPGANSYWIQNDAGIHTTGSVGVGTTNPNSVVPSDNTTILNVGILTAYKLYGDGSALTGLAGNPFLQTVLDTGNTSTTGMSITGVSTFTTAEVTNGTITNLTGTAATITNGTVTNLTGTAATITTLDTTNFTTTNGTVTNLTGTAATITTLDSTNATITNGTVTSLSGTAATITTLDSTNGSIINFTPTNINASGVITATSFVGDGSGLTGAGSTVADDTTTNETFFPVFTQTTSGIITASKVSTTKFTFNPSTGEASATNFNSTSDESLKTNIHTVENSLDIVDQLRGVSFDWKENGKGSYGVIAQELEQVLPELVAQTDPKSVNYNGIIGVLIEAIKELKKDINELKSK